MTKLRRLPLGLFAAGLALCALGWLMVYSATGQTVVKGSDAWRQAFYIVVGMGLMVGLSLLDYRWLRKVAVPIYLINLAMLMAVALPGIGHSAKGAQRWISLGPMGTFQPSELAKLLLIITLCCWLARRAEITHGQVSDPLTLIVSLLHVGILFVLIMLQPDLGTAMVLVAVMTVLLFVIGMSPIYLAGMLTAGLALVTVALKGYQRDRLLIYLYPEADPLGMGYSLIQSKTAIGSGGLWGKGLFAGNMTQHGFVPEHMTDFIFAVVGEELGLLGAVGLILLYALLLWLILRIAVKASDRFGMLLCTGVLAMIGFHVFVNIGMTIGLMPVTGVPLPFISYGGSAILTNLMALGLVGSVYLHQREPALFADGRQSYFNA
jgi:rod shape determining protein RodA